MAAAGDARPRHDNYYKLLDRDLKEAADIVEIITAGWKGEALPEGAGGHTAVQGKVHDMDMIPPWMFTDCHGIAFLYEFKAAFLVSVHAGNGFVVSKLNKGLPGQAWSAPVPFVLGGAGIGLTGGANRSSVVLFIMSEHDLRRFAGPDVSLGGDVNVSAGPVGRDSRAQVDLGKGGFSTNFAYSFSQGLFLGSGATVSGSTCNSIASHHVYGKDVTVDQLLKGEKGKETVDTMSHASQFYTSLSKAEEFGKHFPTSA
ncbi:SH3 domain-containing protein [Porphyridium purpureum]|uniref:SH3 domain-containing protein n=1 Tax=Porphyridium purpureum TaxID=35688 RepID=A0A5J4Z588_PORPP|nr:SH3 domain-containing protein [Porphyridium purpureum]|eukprot:POR3241..scf295_1